MVSEEVLDKFKNTLYRERMHGDINFTGDVEIYEQNGNTYVEVECSEDEDADEVRETFEIVLNYEMVVNFDGPRVKDNPGEEGCYVYVVSSNNQTLYKPR